MGSKKLQVLLPILFAVVMIIGMAIGFQLKEKTMSPTFFGINKRSSLQELTELIKSKYVDKLAYDSINALAATELLQHLDPHSVFIPATELSLVNEEMQGNFEGIGIEYRLIDDTVNVMNVIKDGPSQKAGLQIGDQLLAVADTIKVSGVKINPTDVRKYFRGPINSTVKVKFKRANAIQSVTITRNVIPISSIDAAYEISPGIGYIRINKFAARTYEAFMQQLEMLQKKNIQSLVLDLRGNGGGLMKEAIDIADEFLADDQLIVYTEGEHAPKMEYRAKRPGIFEKGKLVVLIDETSASASEVLAGALQDCDRATIVGRRSFGKGLVQQQFQLSDGSAVRLTVARYYTPLGRNIQKSYSHGMKAYQEELMSRFQAPDSINKKEDSADTKKVYTTKSGKKVFGGGGITPDSSIAFDSARYPKIYMQLLITNNLADGAYHYFLNNRARFEGYQNPTAFLSSFQPGSSEWTYITGYAQKNNINLLEIDAGLKKIILTRFKSLISRYLWNTNGYFIVANSEDPIVQKALQSIK
jgi:carboxyl-terminal processing protease